MTLQYGIKGKNTVSLKINRTGHNTFCDIHLKDKSAVSTRVNTITAECLIFHIIWKCFIIANYRHHDIQKYH
jgi:hypothetical protein